MKTYMISYTNNGQSIREDKKTILKPKAIASHYKNLGFENIKVRVLSWGLSIKWSWNIGQTFPLH